MSKIVLNRILYSKKIYLRYILLNTFYKKHILLIITPFGFGIKYIPESVELIFNSYKYNNIVSIIYKKKKNLNIDINYSFLGLYWVLIKQYIQDFTKIFVIDFEFRGMGYKGIVITKRKLQLLKLYIGLTHLIFFELPFFVKIIVPPFIVDKSRRYLLFGCTRQKLFEIIYFLKSLKKIDSYNGKGIFFFKEVFKLKAGKQQKH